MAARTLGGSAARVQPTARFPASPTSGNISLSFESNQLQDFFLLRVQPAAIFSSSANPPGCKISLLASPTGCNISFSVRPTGASARPTSPTSCKYLSCESNQLQNILLRPKRADIFPSPANSTRCNISFSCEANQRQYFLLLRIQPVAASSCLRVQPARRCHSCEDVAFALVAPLCQRRVLGGLCYYVGRLGCGWLAGLLGGWDAVRHGGWADGWLPGWRIGWA